MYHTFPVKWNKMNILYVCFTTSCILVGCCWWHIPGNMGEWEKFFTHHCYLLHQRNSSSEKEKRERRWRYITARKYSLCSSVTYYGERTLYKYVLNSEIPLRDTVKLRNVETRSGKQTSSFFFYLFWIFTPTMTKILALKNLCKYQILLKSVTIENNFCKISNLCYWWLKREIEKYPPRSKFDFWTNNKQQQPSSSDWDHSFISGQKSICTSHNATPNTLLQISGEGTLSLIS